LISNLKILYGYPYYPSVAYDDVEALNLAHVQKLREAGFDIEGICLSVDPPSNALTFPELDYRWKHRDEKLLRLYESIQCRLEGKEVFINAAGLNLHPEFVSSLSCFTVFQCFDDPENSHNLSHPAAGSYDLSLVGNIAELDSYRSWGVAHVEWVPLGLMPEIYDQSLTYDDILRGDRDIDLFMMIDRQSGFRRDRVEALHAALPQGHFFGRGWPRGFLPADQQLAWLRRSKIGPNIHNSTGPINYRTYYLPANGVLQICDNKSHLGGIFRLGVEAIGYDTIAECVDLCRYYLDHDEERRRIAAEGWRRATTEYTEIAVFRRTVGLIEKYLPQKRPATAAPLVVSAAPGHPTRRILCCLRLSLFRKRQQIRGHLHNVCRRMKRLCSGS
jgi:spore maturation protein CgeB